MGCCCVAWISTWWFFSILGVGYVFFDPWIFVLCGLFSQIVSPFLFFADSISYSVLVVPFATLLACFEGFQLGSSGSRRSFFVGVSLILYC